MAQCCVSVLRVSAGRQCYTTVLCEKYTYNGIQGEYRKEQDGRITGRWAFATGG